MGWAARASSLFETAAALSQRYRVHAIDLPGFGSSSKPARGAYNARWFSELMLGLMDELEVSSAHVVGNSMGGRVAIESALTAPERVGALGLLCPAVAWVKRGFHPLVRLLRPELGLLPHGFSRGAVAAQFWSMFCERDLIDPAVADLMVDEFRRIYHTAGARYAFLASARNIYLEKPLGRGGFYPRLAQLESPALFIWGSHDPLVPAAFGRRVEECLPSAEQVTLDGCGHVPQVERPEETHELLLGFFAEADAPERCRGRLADAGGCMAATATRRWHESPDGRRQTRRRNGRRRVRRGRRCVASRAAIAARPPARARLAPAGRSSGSPAPTSTSATRTSSASGCR